jgi:hypothetical protein
MGGGGAGKNKGNFPASKIRQRQLRPSTRGDGQPSGVNQHGFRFQVLVSAMHCHVAGQGRMGGQDRDLQEVSTSVCDSCAPVARAASATANLKDDLSATDSTSRACCGRSTAIPSCATGASTRSDYPRQRVTRDHGRCNDQERRHRDPFGILVRSLGNVVCDDPRRDRDVSDFFDHRSANPWLRSRAHAADLHAVGCHGCLFIQPETDQAQEAILSALFAEQSNSARVGRCRMMWSY